MATNNKEEMSKQEMFSRLLMAWVLETNSENQQFVTDDEKDAISNIIHHRTKMFNVRIPIECAYIISLCSGGNPGMAIIIYYHFLEMIVERRGAKLPRDGYIISSEDFALSFPTAFPDVENPTQYEKYEKMWDAQKDAKGRNLVDSYDYWDKLFV